MQDSNCTWALKNFKGQDEVFQKERKGKKNPPD